MTLTATETTVHEFLAERGTLWPPTAIEIAEHTGYPISTVYVALKGVGAQRTKRGKNQFGYVLPDESGIDFPSVEKSLGTVDNKPWKEVAESTMQVVAEAALLDNLTAKDYADGFESLGYRFLELSAHANAVQDRADWKIVLGFEIDTEKE